MNNLSFAFGKHRKIQLFSPSLKKNLAEYEYLTSMPKFSSLLGQRIICLVGIIDDSQPLIKVKNLKNEVFGIYSYNISGLDFVPIRVAENYEHLQTLCKQIQTVWTANLNDDYLPKTKKILSAYQNFVATFAKTPNSSSFFWCNYAFRELNNTTI